MFSLRSLSMRHYLIRAILTRVSVFRTTSDTCNKSLVIEHEEWNWNKLKNSVTNRALWGGVERWVSSERCWRWCHADACPHRCIGKVTSTSTVKMAHWWPGEGYTVYKGENRPRTKDWSTSLTFFAALFRCHLNKSCDSFSWIYGQKHW